MPPEVTWERIRPILRTLGITRVADVTGLDDVGIPVHQAIRPASHTLSVSQGKGVTHELARVSAAMEMIELAHAEVVDQPVQRGPAREILGDGGDTKPTGCASSSWCPARWWATRWCSTGSPPADC